MISTHHPDEATLMAYAAGSLPEAFNLIVAAHVSLCDQCRAHVESCDAVGGALLGTAPSVEMGVQSLTRALSRLDSLPMTVPSPRRCAVLPAPVQDYVGGDLESVNWRPVGMGVRQAVLKTSAQATARLLHIPAGATMPDHSHRGREMTLVLKGAFRNGDVRFARSDIESADDHVTHHPVAEEGEDCICLAVTDAPLRFQGWMPRIIQRFTRI